MFWETKSPPSIKEIKETGIFRLLNLFSKIWKIGERYRADKMGESTELYPTPTPTLKDRENKLFH